MGKMGGVQKFTRDGRKIILEFSKGMSLGPGKPGCTDGGDDCPNALCCKCCASACFLSKDATKPDPECCRNQPKCCPDPIEETEQQVIPPAIAEAPAVTTSTTKVLPDFMQKSTSRTCHMKPSSDTELEKCVGDCPEDAAFLLTRTGRRGCSTG